MNSIKTGLLLLFTCLLGLAGSAQKNPSIDKLKTLLEETKQDTARIRLLTDLSWAYFKSKAYAEASGAISEALQIVEEKGLDIPVSLHWAIAEKHFIERQMPEALLEMERVTQHLTKSTDLKSLAKAQDFVARIHHYAGEFALSIDHYQKNIQFIKQNKLFEMLPAAYGGLASVYRSIQEYEEQRKNLVLMADAALKSENPRSAGFAYLGLGDIGMEIDSNFVYAIDMYEKSLDNYEQVQDSGMISFMLLRIGWNHYLNNSLDTALNYFFHSLEYSLPINRLTAITNAYGNIGTIYRDKKDFDKAIKFYKKSIEYSHTAKDWYNLSWLHLDMSIMHKNQGNYKLAYENHVLHKQFSDSLEMKKFNEGMADARSRYEADKAEKELELVSLKLSNQKYLVYGFAGLVFLVLVIGFLVFRSSRLSAKRRITEMNHKISEVTQKNLRQQMNPHFIFNTLNSIQYYMYQHDKISTNNYLTKFSLLMRKTLENSQHTAIPIKDELDALQLYLELESLRFKEKFAYSIEVDEDIDTLLLKIPTMLIQPYVENSICHGLVNKNGKGYVSINLKQNDDELVCTIEDNGIGRVAAMRIKDQKNGNHASLGTKITESRLSLVNSLYGKNMKINYQDLQDNNGEGSGTKVQIHIPVMA
jgi:tetratricopeptide (TPR) repeat protein